MSLLAKKERKSSTRQISNRLTEAYRTLLTNIEFVSIQKELKTIVFTSSNRDEGKSTTVANYGLALAEQGKEVLILDCDLRNPTQHELFKLPNDMGLTEVLLRKIEPEDAIQKTGFNGLSLLTTGLMPPNPASILNSDRMIQLVETLKNYYDVILFDTCPVSVASDTLIVAAMMDGTVMVIRANQSNRDVITRSLKSLELANVNVIGTVLNAVPRDYNDDYYYYGY
jgi:capsular exopolysaccharide synthesis family protein